MRPVRLAQVLSRVGTDRKCMRSRVESGPSLRRVVEPWLLRRTDRRRGALRPPLHRERGEEQERRRNKPEEKHNRSVQARVAQHDNSKGEKMQRRPEV